MVDRLIVSVRRHCQGDLAAIALHPQGDPPEPGSRASATRNIPAQPDRTSAPTPVGALATARSGLAAALIVVPETLRPVPVDLAAHKLAEHVAYRTIPGGGAKVRPDVIRDLHSHA